MLRKIVAIGPESTGKSSLCEQLAQYYNTLWCPEYAREYLLAHGSKYSYDDLLTVAKGQVASEENYIELASDMGLDARRSSGDSLLFIDTDMHVMKVWCEFVFGKCHQFILDQIIKRHYDLYLLCNVDLEWVPDELREYPDLGTRKNLYRIYKTILENQRTPWVEINGNNAERLERAIDSVNSLLN